MVYGFIELGHNRYETYGGTHRESPRHTATLSRLLRVRVSRECRVALEIPSVAGIFRGSAVRSSTIQRSPAISCDLILIHTI